MGLKVFHKKYIFPKIISIDPGCLYASYFNVLKCFPVFSRSAIVRFGLEMVGGGRGRYEKGRSREKSFTEISILAISQTMS